MPTENVHKLVLINPVSEAIQAMDTTYATRLADLAGKRLGLIDNSKSNAGRLLDMVATILHMQYGFREILRHRKPSASKPVAPEVIAAWAAECDLAIVGVGD